MKVYVAFFSVLLLGFSLMAFEAFSDDGFPILVSSPHAIATMPTPAPSTTVPVAEVAAPPAWAQDVMVSAQTLPVIGPIVTKALLYLGILSSLLTMFAGFLMSSLAVLAGAFNFAGITKAVVFITDFQKGKFMYWIKFFSMFNAKKKDLP